MKRFPNKLASGYLWFKDGRLTTDQERYKNLAEEGQKPEVLVIGCCDSRAAPETIFSCGPGEIFVVRNVANLVPPYEPDGTIHGTSAAIEFAIEGLGVKHILVMGHGRCGGVKAFRTQIDGREALSDGDFIGKWIRLLEPALNHVCSEPDAEGDLQLTLERAGIRLSLQNLMTFPFVKSRVEKGEIQLHGAWFDIAKGTLMVLDRETDSFMPLPAGTGFYEAETGAETS